MEAVIVTKMKMGQKSNDYTVQTVVPRTPSASASVGGAVFDADENDGYFALWLLLM